MADRFRVPGKIFVLGEYTSLFDQDAVLIPAHFEYEIEFFNLSLDSEKNFKNWKEKKIESKISGSLGFGSSAARDVAFFKHVLNFDFEKSLDFFKVKNLGSGYDFTLQWYGKPLLVSGKNVKEFSEDVLIHVGSLIREAKTDTQKHLIEEEAKISKFKDTKFEILNLVEGYQKMIPVLETFECLRTKKLREFFANEPRVLFSKGSGARFSDLFLAVTLPNTEIRDLFESQNVEYLGQYLLKEKKWLK